MRAVVVAVMVVLLSASVWLLYEVREAHDSWGAYIVQTEQSRLVEARRIEEMLRNGRVDEALSHLQRNRDLFVLQLAAARSAIDAGSWRWSNDKQTLESAASSLREEAEYRHAVGESASRLAKQVRVVLDEFNE